MPELPAPSNNRNVSSLQRWQSLKTVGGCMGAFSHMFHLSRMLGGSNDCLIATPDAQLGGKTLRRHNAEKQSSLQLKRTKEAEPGIDLRKILDAKQEPFVLQEVIWEKKHPVRTRSSRELKFDLNDMVLSSSKSHNSKRAKSKDSRRHSDVGRDGDSVARSYRHGGASSGLVKGCNVPAESMVALPSPQASPHARKTRPSSGKMPSAGKSPVKSPNKKALLMEAAAKILEGSNRRTSSSARSLLRELDGSKQAQELSKSPINKAPLGGEPTTKQKSLSQNITTSVQKRVGLNKQHSNADKSFSFANQPQQDSISLSSRFGMTDDEVLMVMRSRIISSDGMPAARGELSQLATMADSCDESQQSNHFQWPKAHFSTVDRTLQEERVTTLVDVSKECIQRTADVRPVDERTHGEVEFIMVPEALGRDHRQPDRNASVVDRQDLKSALYADLSSGISFNELPSAQEFVNSLEWNTPPEHAPDVEIPNESFELPMSRNASIDEIDCGISIASSGNNENSIGDINCAHSCTFLDIDSNGLLKSYISGDGTPRISGETFMGATESDTTVKSQMTPVLLLCNYSWWTEVEIQAHSSTLKNETLNEYAEYDSPLIATKGPCVVKIFEERKGVGNLEEESSTSSDHSYSEEFQQSSPVSVLDMVYDGCPVLGKPFNYFDEARQKLLDSVRRYEMLAHMDLDMLIKINEDSCLHESEEEFDSSSFKESWGSDVTDPCATHHQAPLMASPDYQLSRYRGFINLEVEDLGFDNAYGSYDEATKDDLYVHSDEDFYMQQLQEVTDEDGKSISDFKMDTRARFQAERESTLKALLDCASEPSDLHTATGPRPSRDTFDEVESSVVLTALLHMDMATSSWSIFHEEVEVMEIELESFLFAALMEELLSDLLW